jgi:hypothetical protein
LGQSSAKDVASAARAARGSEQRRFNKAVPVLHTRWATCSFAGASHRCALLGI